MMGDAASWMAGNQAREVKNPSAVGAAEDPCCQFGINLSKVHALAIK
jgi:hypothetical protein